MLEDNPLVAEAVGAKPHLALVALKGEVGEVDVASQLCHNLKVLGYCNWPGVYKILESNIISSLPSHSERSEWPEQQLHSMAHPPPTLFES